MSQNFTPVQAKKRLPQPICLTALCPSMDIVAVGLCANANANANAKINTNDHLDVDNAEVAVAVPEKAIVSNSVIVYRTISWQKMFSISQSDLSNAATTTATSVDTLQLQKEDDANSDPGPAEIGATQLTWSPDGRILGIALTNGSTLFYDIESCASPGVPPSPIFSLPRPPSQTMTMPVNGSASVTASASASVSGQPEIPHKDSKASASPRMTRSMTNARRKRLMRMSGKTPSHDTSQSMKARSNIVRAEMEAKSKKIGVEKEMLEVDTNKNYRMAHAKHFRIQSMHWQRIRRYDHSEWPFRQYYLDRSTYFLPPCHHTMEGNGSGGGRNGMNFGNSSDGTNNGVGSKSVMAPIGNSNSHAPRGKTPLSILMIMGNNGLSLYLNGRYRIFSIHADGGDIDGAREIISTSDFHILTSSQFQSHAPGKDTTKSLKLCIYNLPSLIPRRYNLQFISYSYGAITSHLKTMREGMSEVYSAWSAALRQLDVKFDQLSNLLIKYNVISQNQNEQEKIVGVRLELLNYILGGHSSRSGDSSNAMDQFFTHPLMNDQLLIRLFRSLEANCAGVEGMLRKNVLGPVRSLVFDVGELYGLVKAMNAEKEYASNDSGEEEEIGFADGLPALMDCETCMRLSETSNILFTISEQCIVQTVEVRHRLECITKWIRATASQVKARGTAADSVQRENARKRRVPELVLRKVSDFLSTPLKTAPEDLERKRGSTESILGILLSDYFSKDRVFLEKTRSPLQRKDNLHSDGFHSFVETPSLKAVLDVSDEICSELFNEPRKVMATSFDKMDIVVEEALNRSDEIVSAVHSRFHGRTEEGNSPFSRFVHWMVMANTCASDHAGCELVQIAAIPVGNEFCETDAEVASSHYSPTFYMTAFLQIPKGCTVTSINFYGDDGNSTLTSEAMPSYEEGRQAIVLLLKKEDGDEFTEELWLVEYDDISFRDVPFNNISNEKYSIQKYDPSTDICRLLINSNDESIDDENVASKWRSLKSKTSRRSSSSLVMSGSRGIGGVVCHTTNTVDLFDLEEDEESDDESGDDED